jgi:pimeloyl-ACP methyl ester carboxylesterase
MTARITPMEFRHRNITVSGAEIHVVEAGPLESDYALFFLHGWPADWSSFARVMSFAASEFRVVAIDLPGIGGSTTRVGSGEKAHLARYVLAVMEALRLRAPTLVGHDVGGMITYSCLRLFGERLGSAVILSTVIPGVDPWDEVRHNPYIWHWGFHAVPELPELLVLGRQAEYFGYFYRTIAARPEAISETSRARYAQAYSTRSALESSFDWFRAFPKDAEENARPRAPVSTRLLYLRGENEPAGIPIGRYVEGFSDAGVQRVSSAIVQGSGHFTPEERPEDVWQQIEAFVKVT